MRLVSLEGLGIRPSSESVVAEDSIDRVCAPGVQSPSCAVERRKGTRERHLDDSDEKKAEMND